MAVMRPTILDRRRVHEALRDARRRTDEVFDLVAPYALYDRPIPERHRLIFYVGHVDAFDWNLLAPALGLAHFNERLNRLFAFGIDPVGGGLPNEPASEWPERAIVEGYVHRVREIIDDALLNGHDIDDARLIPTAIEHRLMHAETLAYLVHQLPYDRKRIPAPSPWASRATDPTPGVIDIPAGRATLGRRRDDAGFGWDNEYDEVVVDVPAFAIESLPVTNGRYEEFLRAGGYERREFWDDIDWAWRTKEERDHPIFWKRDGGEFLFRGMFALAPLPVDQPVYVSLAEARAFARWAKGNLPTEGQFHRAAYGTAEGPERDFPWGNDAPTAARGNFDFEQWDPAPVDSHPAGRSAFGVSDLVGNGWEWTATPFAPFPGFEPFPFYRGYSADFFDGQHFVMKGGSARTAAPMLRRSFRNWFQPHYPYMYAKFRLVRP